MTSDDWRRHLLTSAADIRRLLQRIGRVVVLGMRPETFADRPAFYVPQALQRLGLEIVPVSLYDAPPRILGETVYRSLADVPGRVDLVNVFRRSSDVPGHVDQLLAMAPGAVWLQSGIRNDEAAERLARAGIDVVQDRCLMVDYREFAPRGGR